MTTQPKIPRNSDRRGDDSDPGRRKPNAKGKPGETADALARYRYPLDGEEREGRA